MTEQLRIIEVGQRVAEAARRIRPYVLKTPLLLSTPLSKEIGASVYLKLENEQVTGSFKARGAFNKCLMLREADCGPAVITASTGNHGLASALAFRTLGLQGRVVVPSTIDPDKRTKLQEAGADLLQHGTDCCLSEVEARRLAAASGGTYLSPYNDLDVIAGQGTIGLEIMEAAAGVQAVFVAVGGGGLISGIAAAIKRHKPSCRVVGCSPARSKVMHESVRAGTIVTEESLPTLSDATAGAVEEGAVTFSLCRDLVDEWVLVDEDEIAHAVFSCLHHHRKVVEGSAGVALAALKKVAAGYQGQQVAVVLCGANISLTNLTRIITTHA